MRLSFRQETKTCPIALKTDFLDSAEIRPVMKMPLSNRKAASKYKFLGNTRYQDPPCGSGLGSVLADYFRIFLVIFSGLSSPSTRVEKQSDVAPRATTSDKFYIRQSHTSGHAGARLGHAEDVWIY